jgi:hypothetical protein
MSTTLDGQILFDAEKLQIEVGSIKRDSVERSVAGLDGVLSIDLGGRSRSVKQRGAIRAESSVKMHQRLSRISAFIDGASHKLVWDGGREFDNLRMDSFKVTDEWVSGTGLAADYEIVYTQLFS